MRNLKRALSLVLAVVMVIGLMVVGASAVSYNDLTDKDEIVNKDAVSMLVALDIIQGKPDGSYAPTENVDRAQMAKMISVIMNKGVDNSALYENVNSGLTDIDGNWAKGHINYCYTNGVIAGRGNNTFDPSATVTALEAAKMLLVAIGYDPAIEGFVGTDWALRVSSVADSVGIFRNYTKDLTAPLNRDDAALLIYNALDVEMIQQYSNGYALTYADHRTILSDKYGVIRVEGVVTANEWAILDDDSDTALKEGLTRIENAEGIFSTTTNTQVVNNADNTRTGTFEVSTPVDMLGKSVTMYIKKDTILSKSVVYGDPVVTEDNNVVTTGDHITGGTTRDDDSLASLLKGTGLSITKDTEYYLNYAEVDRDSSDTKDVMNVKGATLTVIDNDNDGYVDYVLSLQKTLSEISAYNTKKESLTVKGMITEDFANVVGYEDVEKDDIVLAVSYGGRTYVEKPETVTGEMEYYTTKVKTDKYMTVDGTDYYEDELENKSSATKFLVDECDTDAGVKFDASYIFYLDDYNNVIAFEETEAAEKNYALILDSAFSVNGLKLSADVKLLLADGTEGTYEVNWSATRNNLFGKDEDEALKNFFGTDDGRYNKEDNYAPAGNAAGYLVTYTLSDDKVVTLDEPNLNLSSRTYVAGKDVLVTGYDHDKYETTDGLAAELNLDIEKGDTYFEIQGNGTNYVYSSKDADKKVTDKSADVNKAARFGIDDETVVFYWDGKDGAVSVGYENLYETQVGVHKYVDAVMYNPESYPNGKTGVANVMLVTGGYHAAKDNDYCLVLDTYRNYTDYNIYTVILEDGTITQLKSEDDLKDLDGVKNMVYTYSTDSKGWTEFESIFKADDSNNDNDNAYYAVNKNDGKTLDKGKTTWVEDVATGYSVAFGYVYVPYAKWVQTYHENFKGQTEWDNMLADRNADVIFNAFDVDTDADTADTIAFEDGQQAVIVYDDKDRVKAAWVIADADDEIVPPEASTGDVISKTTVNDRVTLSADTYSTVSKAIDNAAVLDLSETQASKVNLMVTIDCSTYSAQYEVFATVAAADDADKDTISRNFQDVTGAWSGIKAVGPFATAGEALSNNNVVVLEFTDIATGDVVFAAYRVVE